ncbi:BSD domain containing protein [Musa troglodytarum]|uniref:BSD domain containing protein n=1 Tax=Musa troglodytarum TaxID=320322 RepID=A0A9E7E9I5_9LILI|nr:BSD domain containing protein [Musa troglodytarum]
MAARGFRGVKDDLSELGRCVLDIACFLGPIGPPPQHESPPSSPRSATPPPPPQKPRPSARALSGILSDLGEDGGGFVSDPSRLSQSSPDRDRRSTDRAGGARAIRVSAEVLEFVSHIIKRPELWLDFPVSVDEEFHMSHTQREHASTVEDCIPDLLALRISLCPTYMSEESFWRKYFALLQPKLSKHDSELLATHQIFDSFCTMKKERHSGSVTRCQNLYSESISSLKSETCVSFQQEDVNETWEDASITRTGSQQSMYQWCEVANAKDTSTDATRLGFNDVSVDTSEGNAFVMVNHMDSFVAAEQVVHSPCSLRRKHVSSGEENTANLEMAKSKMPSDEEYDDWQAVEDSDFVSLKIL